MDLQSVHVRLSGNARRKLKAAAKQAGLNRSAFVEAVVVKQGKALAADPEIVAYGERTANKRRDRTHRANPKTKDT
jgi:uncharacterized protein (DUF1778 family)